MGASVSRDAMVLHLVLASFTFFSWMLSWRWSSERDRKRHSEKSEKAGWAKVESEMVIGVLVHIRGNTPYGLLFHSTFADDINCLYKMCLYKMCLFKLLVENQEQFSLSLQAQ